MAATARPKPYNVRIRLPQHVAQLLREAAERSQRSLNSEVIIAIEAHLARQRQEAPV